MSVEIELEDGSVVNCEVITILTVADAFDEFLDECEFDQLD